MKKITNLLINDFKIKQLGVDFMGYQLQKGDRYSYHHLIIPKKYGGKMDYANGCILCEDTSHPYLHLIEAKDYDLFCYITSEIIDQKIKGYIDKQNLLNIHNLLRQFEAEYGDKITSKGKLLIREEYKRGRVVL